jgi:hypothetical protein
MAQIDAALIVYIISRHVPEAKPGSKALSRKKTLRS